MSTVKELVQPVKGTSTLVRPRFSPGLLLQDSDLNCGIDYGNKLSQLLFRHLFGCGVICGYEVSTTVDKCNVLCVSIKCGLALDCKGGPIELTATETIKITGGCTPELPKEIWVVIRAREHNSAPRDVACTTDDDSSSTVCTRICDGYEIRLLGERPECACGCLPSRYEPPAEPCCTDPPPQRLEESEGDGNFINEKHADWEKCSEEEKSRRRREMVEGAERCDRERRLGVCSCSCCCEWVLLARLTPPARKSAAETKWLVDHTVRRFIRPALSPDYMAYGVKD